MPIKVTIESENEDEETIKLFRDHLCYAITDELGIRLKVKGWDGYSGGDDAYFGLMDKIVRVQIK